jgi:hypothetical protein
MGEETIGKVLINGGKTSELAGSRQTFEVFKTSKVYSLVVRQQAGAGGKADQPGDIVDV